MVDFNKKLKVDRINLFCDVVTKMANGTPAEDNQPIILEEHTEYPPFNPDRDYHLFERFRYNGVVAECHKFELFNPCRDCAIYPCADSYNNCMAFKRMDKVNVFYKKLENVTEE